MALNYSDETTTKLNAQRSTCGARAREDADLQCDGKSEQREHTSGILLQSSSTCSAFCDRCGNRIEDIRYKCENCPDFDYCTQCVKLASSVNPGHDFVPLQGSRRLEGNDLSRHFRPMDEVLDPTTFQLLGQNSNFPTKSCLSCQSVTNPLPAMDIILQDEKNPRKATEDSPA